MLFIFIKEKGKKNMMQKYDATQLFSTLLIIANVSWAVNRHIRMISEGSCDTEDFSLTGINYILKHIHINQ